VNAIGLIFFLITASALLFAPRRWAAVPLLMGCLYMTHGQGLKLGGVALPMVRLLLVVGFVRVVAKGEGVAGGVNLVDKLFMALAGWLLFASFFHETGAAGAGIVFMTGKVAEIGLCYLLIRTFCQDKDEFVSLIGVIAVLLVPIALEMIQEKLTGKNIFSAVLGGVNEAVVERGGRLRARGPFRHAILAGTVGAACVPLMLGIWGTNKRVAVVGLITCLTMVVTCASSGPILSLGFALLAVGLWRFRHLMGMIRWGLVLGYIALELIMSRPAYFIIGELSIGESTGWHRSQLIDSSIKYFGDWFLFGTDHTRSWMPTGVNWSKEHTDITNYFLAFGVMGGFLAMSLLIAMIWICFKWVGDIIDARPDLKESDHFLIWCMGASLFSHVGTSVSVAYYDQSYVFFWFSIATIASMRFLIHEEPATEVAELEEGIEGGFQR